MKFLFAFDFDFTIIDDDSDHYVFKKLSLPLFNKVVICTLFYYLFITCTVFIKT